MSNSALIPLPPPGFEPVASSVDQIPVPPPGFEPVPTAESRSWAQRNFADSWNRGVAGLKTMGDILGGEVGVYSPYEVAQGIVANRAEAQLYPVQPELQAVSEAPTAWEAVKALAAHPGAVFPAAVESVPALVGGVLGGSVAVGPTAPSVAWAPWPTCRGSRTRSSSRSREALRSEHHRARRRWRLPTRSGRRMEERNAEGRDLAAPIYHAASSII